MIYLTMDTSGTGGNRDISHASFKALQRLVTANQISIHIPYVVKREVETQDYKKYIDKYESALSGIEKLDKMNKKADIQQAISGINNHLKALEEAIKNDADSRSKLWFEMLSAQYYEIDETQAKQAFEAYFLGTAPLTEPKDRKDIPDSFVCRGIEKIKTNTEHLHLIVKDKKVANTFKNNSNYTIYEDITVFIESNDIKNKLKGLDKLNNLITNSIQFIENLEKNNPTIESYLSSNIGENIIGKTICDSSIPDDNNGATINSYGEPENIHLDFTNPIYYGEDQIGIKYELEINVSAEFYIYKSDYYSILEEGRRISVSDCNDHYFEAEDEFNLKVTGIISIKLNTQNLAEIAKLEKEELEDYFEDTYTDAEVNIESVDSIELI